MSKVLRILGYVLDVLTVVLPFLRKVDDEESERRRKRKEEDKDKKEEDN